MAIFQLADCSLLTPSSEGCGVCLAWNSSCCLFFCRSWYMLFSQLPIFYGLSIIAAMLPHALVIRFKLNLHMLRSPASSLSSFRDYYRHTSEASDDGPSNEELILQGLANFTIAKVFTKLNRRFAQENHWACFYAFRKMRAMHSRFDTLSRATALFGRLLRKRAHRESKLVVQKDCLKELLENVREARRLELARLMNFGMRFMKKNYINAAICYQQVIDRLKGPPRKQKVPADRAKYILKLSKAVLCIVVRNILDKKMFKFLRDIRHGQQLRSRGNQQITFFKPKKEKVYEHRREDKTERLFKAARVAQILEKKLYLHMKTFLTSITLTESPSSSQSQSDSSMIFANVAQHMIYLTGAIGKLQTTASKSQLEEMRVFKLGQVLKKDQRRGRLGMRECLLVWRRAANEQHLLLRREIIKLEMIKQHYMDQF